MVNSITRILILGIISSTVAHELVLQCSEGYRTWENNQTCTFRDVKINEIAMDVNFQKNFARSDRVNNFLFFDSVMVEIPKKIFDVFTAVKRLFVADCGIETINRYTLERANVLQFLNLSGNKLEELNNYVFSDATQLITLDLSYNNISKIEEKAFNNLKQLDTLLLTGNKLKVLNDGVFSHLSNMKKLYADKNELETIQSGLFQNNTLLAKLSLESNQLVLIDKDLFSSITKIMEYLLLQNNGLTSFEFNDLKVIEVNSIKNKLQKVKLSPYIKRIYLDNNKISEITANDFDELKLTHLSLSWNNITSIESINQISSLVALDLSHNKIGSLKLASFASLKNLTDLNLEDTKITNLQHGTFSQLTALQRLDISYNSLGFIDFDIFTSSHLIQEIFIDGNRLKNINYEEIHKIFPSLGKISIAENNWNCSYLTRMIRNLSVQKITVGSFKSENLIADKTNVKGIYCTDTNNLVEKINTTALHLEPYLNSSAPIFDTTEIKQIMQNAIDDMNKFNDQRVAFAEKLLLLLNKIDQNRSLSYSSHSSMELEAPSVTSITGVGSIHIVMVLMLIVMIAQLAVVVVVVYRNRLPFGRKHGERFATSNTSTLITMTDDI